MTMNPNFRLQKVKTHSMLSKNIRSGSSNLALLLKMMLSFQVAGASSLVAEISLAKERPKESIQERSLSRKKAKFKKDKGT